MARAENTIYIRNILILPEFGWIMPWEAFGKAKGEGFILKGESKEETIQAAAWMLDLINTYGPRGYKKHVHDKDLVLKDRREYQIVDETPRAPEETP